GVIELFMLLGVFVCAIAGSIWFVQGERRSSFQEFGKGVGCPVPYGWPAGITVTVGGMFCMLICFILLYAIVVIVRIVPGVGGILSNFSNYYEPIKTSLITAIGQAIFSIPILLAYLLVCRPRGASLAQITKLHFHTDEYSFKDLVIYGAKL